MIANQGHLILIRHGETLWNQQHRMQGHADSPLTEQGLRQARQLAARLAGIEFAALYSSDLGRALETARSVSRATGHEVIVDARLRERNFGIFEGLTGDEMHARFPGIFTRFKTRDPQFAVPGGESALEFRDRALGCLQEIAQRHIGEVAVVVTHGLVLDMVYRAAYRIDLDERRNFELVNAGINRCRFNRDIWQVDVWGDGSHLELEPVTK
jgi:2,3-bisphosphoglycerate-dependent phosphoglycerate mutase